ncbi:hypothetical protein [Thermococcus sp. AM4]|uniref:hypothetical protein n=1 Tax=Thermococcus sp. (strain AM4) TaxID=246969 RepID=UPI0001870A8B|nr:hypothetical protein [Thermococcus sp. AM4]
MGYSVDRLEKKLKGDYDKGLLIVFFIGSFVLGLATPWVAFDLDNSSGGVISFIAVMASMAFIPLGIFSVLMAIYEVQADAQEFVEAYKRDYPKEPEINLLESGYKKAHEYQNKAFKDALTAWLGLGVYIGLVELALVADNLVVKNWSYLWAVLGICSIASFVGFVLTIISYLRKRSIEKALFAIQLKKSDKAEISIKI